MSLFLLCINLISSGGVLNIISTFYGLSEPRLASLSNCAHSHTSSCSDKLSHDPNLLRSSEPSGCFDPRILRQHSLECLDESWPIEDALAPIHNTLDSAQCHRNADPISGSPPPWFRFPRMDPVRGLQGLSLPKSAWRSTSRVFAWGDRYFQA